MSILNVLNEARDKNKLVSIYIDSDDWERYSVGYVDLITATHIRLRAISKHGAPAGYEIRPLCEIFKVEFDGKYEKKIEKLIYSHDKIFKEISVKQETSGSIILDTLQQSLDDSVMIVVWGSDAEDSLVGYVKSISNGAVSMRLVNEFGEDDGLSTIDISQITSIDFNTQSEQVRSFLYRNQKKKP